MSINALEEGVKEAGRYAVFYGVSVFVSVLLGKVSILPQNDLLVIGLTLALRMVDKYLHVKRKEAMVNNDHKPKGLLSF